MRIENILNFRTFADGIGVLSTSLCALHCLLVPILLVAGTALPASFFTEESFHEMMLALSFPAAIVAFGIGCRQHKDRWVLLLGVLGLTGLGLAAFVLHDLIGEVGEVVVTVGSAALLIVAHVRNYRLCQDEKCDHAQQESGV